ncbi:hypothetical protein PsorP6_008389 [Peronosclerospora sorghi]|uniref:Uncharacterized protein n=1 Tax=Peronosclerospora sorghi TaxID=230839 RepID=A0ACC0WB36_9STRA|nr:hypothetical protein PsorP6_008389 [Peronosclerospora sorghi]
MDTMPLALTPPSRGFCSTSAFSALLSPARPRLIGGLRGVSMRFGRVNWLTFAVDEAASVLNGDPKGR